MWRVFFHIYDYKTKSKKNHQKSVTTVFRYCNLESIKKQQNANIFKSVGGVLFMAIVVWRPFWIVSMATYSLKPIQNIHWTKTVTFLHKKPQKSIKWLNALDFFSTTISGLNQELRINSVSSPNKSIYLIQFKVNGL